MMLSGSATARVRVLLATIHRQRQQVITARDIFGNQRDGGRVDDEGGKIYAFLSEIFRQHIADGSFGQKAETHQQAAQRLMCFALLLHGDAQLVVADHAFGYQQVPDGLLGLLLRSAILIP